MSNVQIVARLDPDALHVIQKYILAVNYELAYHFFCYGLAVKTGSIALQKFFTDWL